MRHRDRCRKRLQRLYTDLADARTAAMISGADAAALRTQLVLLTGRRRFAHPGASLRGAASAKPPVLSRAAYLGHRRAARTARSP
jgi:hypothetical protein